MVVSLQKEALINQSDPCNRIYILRQGSLQASASDKLMREMEVHKKPVRRMTTKNLRVSNWKAKMQVRMIERGGDLVCPQDPFQAPQPLPFQVISLKKSILVTIHMKDMQQILDMVPPKQVFDVRRQMFVSYSSILESVKPKTLRDTNQGKSERGSEAEQSMADPLSTEEVEEGPDPSELLSESRLDYLEGEVDKCIDAMSKLYENAKFIPRMVATLAARQGRVMQPMPPLAQKALVIDQPRGSMQDSSTYRATFKVGIREVGSLDASNHSVGSDASTAASSNALSPDPPPHCPAPKSMNFAGIVQFGDSFKTTSSSV